MSDILLHFGLHKTASGTLQRQFFPKCFGLQCFTTLDSFFYRFYCMVVSKDTLYFDVEKARSLLAPHLAGDMPNLLSNEAFSGPLYTGAIENCLDHRAPIVENLRNVYPEAKAIIVLRRQDSYAVSVYRQYLKAGGTRNAMRFFGLGKYEGKCIFPMDRFNYLPYLNLLVKSFPKGLLILPFEEFVRDQNTFLNKLTDFIGIDCPQVTLKKENSTRLGSLGLEVSRWFNHIFRSRLNPSGMIPGIPQVEGGSFKFVPPSKLLHDKWFVPFKKEGKIYDIGRMIFEKNRHFNEQIDQQYSVGLHKYEYY